MYSLLRFFSRIGFKSSSSYWENRYASGGDSGAGSEGLLAQYKADFLNKFVEENAIESVIEFGCGDGRQLSHANYKKYIGLDVAETALQFCKNKFGDDPSKNFYLYNSFVDKANFEDHRAELSLSLDVIYHLIEDSVFEKYIADLFSSALHWVIIYSSNIDSTRAKAHVRHRKFTDYVASNIQGWSLQQHVKNKYSYELANSQTSHADFFVYRKASQS